MFALASLMAISLKGNVISSLGTDWLGEKTKITDKERANATSNYSRDDINVDSTSCAVEPR